MNRILQVVVEKNMYVKQAAFADDISGAGKLLALKIWWDAIIYYGPFLGYYAKPSKSWLIVKPEYRVEASNIFANAGINITVEGRKHLGAVIGTEIYKEEFVNESVDKWVMELQNLSKIALSEPHVAYAAYVHGIQHKYTYMMRTIPNIAEKLVRLDQAIDRFIKSLLNNYDFNANERTIFSLPVKFGGLGIKIPSTEADHQYKNSVFITESLKEHVVEQKVKLEIDSEEIKKRKNIVKTEKLTRDETTVNNIKSSLSSQQKRILDCVSELGASNWLTTLPIKKYDFYLDKQSFRDAIYLRYDIMLPKLPINCVCGAAYTVNHALSCPRGGFNIIRHNEIRDLTGDLLNIICNDVEIEPKLTPLSGETLKKNHQILLTKRE